MTNPVGITAACTATAVECSERFFKINGVMTKNDVLEAAICVPGRKPTKANFERRKLVQKI